MDSQQPDGGYYVLSGLAERKQAITRLSEGMVLNRDAVEKYLDTDREKAADRYENLQYAKQRLIEAVTDCRRFLLELEESDLAAYAGTLATGLAGFNLMTRDYGPLTGVLSGFADKLPAGDTVSAATIGHCMNQVKMGYFPTDPNNLTHILRGIIFPPGITTNLFDPCCGEGQALKKLAVGNNCFTYGVELDESRAQAAQSELHRVGFGSYFHSRISHEAFHLMLLNPPYLTVLTEGGNRTRDEKRFLADSYCHLMLGGLLIYIVPYYRLTPDICRVLCDNFADISIHRFAGAEFKKWRQAVVMGTRIKRIDGSVLADALAELACVPENIPPLTELAEGRYALPAKPKKVEIFKGAMFNEAELARQLRQSKSLDNLLTVKGRSGEIRRPPLPFTFAQLGLVGGSGLINGLIECDRPHIIKGRIVKEVRADTTENRTPNGALVSTEIKERVSNKMIFNILTPEGFKSLA